MHIKYFTRHYFKRFYLAFRLVLPFLLYFTPAEATVRTEKQVCTLSSLGWSASERWVWGEIQRGMLADLATYKLGDRENTDTELWSQQQHLSSQFIETMFLEKTCQEKIPRRGVNISGAWFREPIDLSYAVLSQPLSLVKARFDKEVIMDGLNSTATLRFSGSIFKAGLRLSGIILGGDLFLNDDAQFNELDLSSAKITGQLDMTGSRYVAPVDMDSLKVDNRIDMNSSYFEEAVDITYASIGNVLVLPGDYDDIMDLTSTQIGNELRLSRKIRDNGIENGHTILILRNTTVTTLQDQHGTWPEQLELDGFKYERLGGYGISSESAIISRPAKRFIEDWLFKDESYTAQPYRQLAEVLQRAGLESKAKRILYAGKERERHEAFEDLEANPSLSKVTRWLGLSLLNYTMGYGYRYSYSLYCVIILVVIGVLVLKCSGEGRNHHMPYGIAYSLDMLLPIIQLRKYHYDVTLKAPVRHYFYFHMLMGYALASFLIAGLSGLTE